MSEAFTEDEISMYWAKKIMLTFRGQIRVVAAVAVDAKLCPVAILLSALKFPVADIVVVAFSQTHEARDGFSAGHLGIE